MYYLLWITTLFFGLYHFFIKVASEHINQIVGSMILQITAVIVWLIYFYSKINQIFSLNSFKFL